MTRERLWNENRLRSGDWLVLLIVCVALYGTAAFSGRPLSVHEGRLPELAREMVNGQSDWLLPQSGGRPWLERPPLPHWFTALSMKLFDRTDPLWVARLPAAAMGGCIASIGAWMSARWFGRTAGLIGGLGLATSYEIYQYATLAEDDIFLGAISSACMAMFVREQWPITAAADGFSSHGEDRCGVVRAFVGRRPWSTLVFFVLLGATNLAKGPLVGALPICVTISVFLSWNRDVRSVRHYAWLWGWLIFLALTLAWPLWAVRHYPDIVDNWRFDYLDDPAGGDVAAVHAWDEPWWYYLALLPLALAPWTWATLIGLWTTARAAWIQRNSAERFLWCWAISGLVVLSLPARKHHHYLVPILMPWAILSMRGVVAAGRSLSTNENRLTRQPSTLVTGVIVTSFIAVGGWIQLRVAGRDERSLAQLAFEREVQQLVPQAEPVFINADVGSLEFFRMQFDLNHKQQLLHNLTFLRDPAIANPVAYVVTRAKDRQFLEQLGVVDELAAVTPASKPKAADPHFALFRVALAPNRERTRPPSSVGVMQAMGRKPGPWAGGAP